MCLMTRNQLINRRILPLLIIFMFSLILSGLTAFPLETEIILLSKVLGLENVEHSDTMPALHFWITMVRDGILDTYNRYPFMAYGTDWLAFAHVVIAIAFLGPLYDPLRNRWVVTFGMIACAGVLPMALIAGSIRGIPFFWRLIDCSFGVFGFIPLALTYRYIKKLEDLAKVV